MLRTNEFKVQALKPTLRLLQRFTYFVTDSTQYSQPFDYTVTVKCFYSSSSSHVRAPFLIS
jgi:hypothetical protein